MRSVGGGRCRIGGAPKRVRRAATVGLECGYSWCTGEPIEASPGTRKRRVWDWGVCRRWALQAYFPRGGVGLCGRRWHGAEVSAGTATSARARHDANVAGGNIGAMVCVGGVSSARVWYDVWGTTSESGSTLGAVCECVVMQRLARGVLVGEVMVPTTPTRSRCLRCGLVRARMK
jgi:hypothetical protein